ncbi:MAG: SDR family NAD(P)-dependent oxidoreductase [Novosphingobium sp.]|jgi:short-subunit dehydrogenase|nr:SDR family NAD(P)-dependent oxidoreductase [Novosphingobium sp.]
MAVSEFAAKYGPWALITGASEGTGSAFAHRLVDAGLKVILVARREGPLAALADEIRARGGECVTASVDLSAPDAAERIAAAAGDREVGLLITNAGADANGSMFLDKDLAAWEQLVTMNVNTTMRLAHRFGRAMRERGRGGMILVSSGACYGGLSGISAYCASKAFVLAFAEGLWAELRHHNIDVLTLVLGRTDTPAHRKILEESGQPVPTDMATSEEVAEVGLRQLPHGPIWNWGQTNDVAGMAPNSPDDRRAKILAIEAMSAAYAGKKA